MSGSSKVAGEAGHGAAPARMTARAAVILTACCVIFGAGLPMVKIANTGISPLLNAGLRSIASTAVVFLWARYRGVRLFERDGTLLAGIFAGGLFAAEFLTLYAGLATTTAARGTIFLHCAPFVAAAGEHYLIPGHRLNRIKVAGLVAAFVGLVVTVGDSLTAGGASLAGDLLCLAGGIFWGATTVLVRATRLRLIASEKTLLYQLAASSLILPVASLIAGEAGILKLTPVVLGAFAFTVLAVVLIGYSVWFWLMRTTSAASLHSFSFLTPIFGVVAGNLILNEPLSPWIVGGLALVAAGIWLVNRPSTDA